MPNASSALHEKNALNGAQALVKTLVSAGIEVCFTNPGTSEMHFVAALDGEPGLRAVLTLFEGVATGAADGYARMADKPAATLLHLGCGLGNGLANLHNARKGRVPVLNIVGDHATTHTRYDAQLQSDIETVARNVSPGFVRTSRHTHTLCQDAADAIVAARNRQVATLILPADVSWGAGGQPCTVPLPLQSPVVDDDTLADMVVAIRSGRKTALLLGGLALREDGLRVAAQIAAQTGIRLLAETFPTRMTRGAGLPAVERLAYLAELATMQLEQIEHLILVDSKVPVSFFAYPGKPGELLPAHCEVHTLAHGQGQEPYDVKASLEKLACALDAVHAVPVLQQPQRPTCPGGKLTAEKVCKAIGYWLPDNAIIIDESITSGLMLGIMTAGAPRHDLMTLTGGAIGQGLPNAVGASLACPDRPVLALVGDGSAMYTVQSLWTMARENLNVIVVVFNNASYSVLNIELERVGVESLGAKARSQLSLENPSLNFAYLAQGMGVHGVRVDTSAALIKALEYAGHQKGPHLIEVMIPEALSGFKRRVLPWLLHALPVFPRSIARMLKRKMAP